MLEQNETLSERELEILRLVATGAQNKEIARQLVISPNTVKVHLRNIFAKIGVASRTEATLYAINIGLVKPSAAQELTEEPEEGAPAGAPFSLSETVSGANQNTESDTQAVDTQAVGTRGVGVLEAPAESILPTPSESIRPGRTWRQIALVAVFAMLLIGSGMLSARMLVPSATLSPATTSLPPEATLSVQRWGQHAALPVARKGMGIAEYENDFYLFGGETSSGVDGACLRYNPTSNTWGSLTSKPTPVSDIQAALLGEKIYIPGGRLANGQSSDRLEVYNPRTDSWETKAKLPMPLNAYALATFEGRIYLFGGKSGRQFINKVFEYDPQQDRWQERSPLSSPRAYASAVTVGAKIHLLGGFDGRQALALNQAYLPARDANGEPAWESLAPLPQGRYSMGAAHLAGVIFVLGGVTENKAPASSSLQYLVRPNQWLTFEAPPVKVGASSALLSSGNYLYMLGGQASAGLSASNQSYQAIFTIAVPAISNDR